MSLADVLVLGIILLPFAQAASAGLRRDPAARRRAAAGTPAALWGALALVGGFAALAAAGVPTVFFAASPAALILAALIALVAAAVASFSTRHMAADRDLDRFMAKLAALAGSALGFAFADHAALFMAFWVASGLLLADLIGHVRSWPQARAAARRARLTFIVGDAMLAAGLALLALDAGSLSIGAMLAHVSAGGGEGAALPAFLALGGAMARSAIAPAHGWLMTSMTAPTPVSAMMHAGLVNAGGFAVVKLAPLFVAAPAALTAAFAIGGATALFGGALMLSRSDVKRSLAGSTVGQMGFMLMQCGLGAFAHALFHLVAHGLFKAALFLGAGGTVGAKPAARGDLRVGPAVAAAGAAAILLFSAAGAPVALEKPSTLLALFALATGAQAAGVAFGPKLRVSALALVAALGVVFATLYAGGVWIVAAALGDSAPSTRPAGPLEWTGLALFAALWAAAAIPDLRARLLPPAVLVALINAGRDASATGSRAA